MSSYFFFFQAEDGIRVAQESRGLGDVYKRQKEKYPNLTIYETMEDIFADPEIRVVLNLTRPYEHLSLIHI